MFAVESLRDAARLLAHVYQTRLLTTLGGDAKPASVRGAVGLFLVRDDGANGSKLANEVVSSFGYWDARTGKQFDGVFLGWGYDGEPAFLEQAFVRCVRDLEEELEWHYHGGAQLLLVDFVHDPRTGLGAFDFTSCVPVDLTRLLQEKKYAQLAPVIEEILRPLADWRPDEGPSPTWRVSDYIAAVRTRRFVWQQLVKKLGALLGWADELANFAVRDLRRIH